jgi:GntR family transcriptional repressor for pyruvate dehydrogenase complex
VFRKIPSRRISTEIMVQFKDLLSRGELKPGDVLPSERELASLFGVSRPPLRDALNALQALGYVEIRPRSKIIVKSAVQKILEDPLSLLIGDDIERLLEVLEIRRGIESWTAYRAAERSTDEDIERLQMIVQRDQENVRENKEDAKLDADFHVAVSMATNNTIQSHLMASCHRLLWNSQKVIRQKIFRKEENRLVVAEQHLRILEAIKDKDSFGASTEAIKHIDFAEKELTRIFSGERLSSC